VQTTGVETTKFFHPQTFP